MVISDGILAVPQNRKLSEFHSKPFHGLENARNSVLFNRNRCKLSKFCSEAFSGRENSSEFRSVEQKNKRLKFCSGSFCGRENGSEFHFVEHICIEANFRKFVPKHFAEEKTL
jgi:hypothetical protein